MEGMVTEEGDTTVDVLKSLLLRDRGNAPYIREKRSENEGRFSSWSAGERLLRPDRFAEKPDAQPPAGGDIFLYSVRVKCRREPGNE